MRIHAEPQLFSASPWFFPIPAAASEEHSDVTRFQHYEPVALRFEAETEEITVRIIRRLK